MGTRRLNPARFRALTACHGVCILNNLTCTLLSPSVLASRPSIVLWASSALQRIWLKRKSCISLFSKTSLSLTLAALATIFFSWTDSARKRSPPPAASADFLSLRAASAGRGAFLKGHLFVHLF